jgi:hypothetical protein
MRFPIAEQPGDRDFTQLVEQNHDRGDAEPRCDAVIALVDQFIFIGHVQILLVLRDAA